MEPEESPQSAARYLSGNVPCAKLFPDQGPGTGASLRACSSFEGEGGRSGFNAQREVATIQPSMTSRRAHESAHSGSGERIASAFFQTPFQRGLLVLVL